MGKSIEAIRAEAIRASARILKQRLDLIGKWVSEEEALLLARVPIRLMHTTLKC